MENTTESRETFAASNPTPQGQDGSSLNAAFDVDAFVHASGDGFGNTAPLRSDTGAIDMDAISQVAHVTQGAGKLTRKEKKHAKREMKRRKKEAKKAEKEAKKTYSSIKSQLKDRDKELSDKMADARKKRDSAKDVVNYIGYNKMYQDGICEVEEGMFSSCVVPLFRLFQTLEPFSHLQTDNKSAHLSFFTVIETLPKTVISSRRISTVPDIS